nr:MAG TPA: hypothetical protein [Caudoviricetes sp.]
MFRYTASSCHSQKSHLRGRLPRRQRYHRRGVFPPRFSELGCRAMVHLLKSSLRDFCPRCI